MYYTFDWDNGTYRPTHYIGTRRCSVLPFIPNETMDLLKKAISKSKEPVDVDKWAKRLADDVAGAND